MKKLSKFFGIIVVSAIVGFTMTGCDLSGLLLEGNKPNAPAAPSVSFSSAGVSANLPNIIVSWSSVPDATGYTIYRSTSQYGTYTSVGTTTSTTWQNTGLSATTTYFYKVAAYNSFGESAQSANSPSLRTPHSVSGGIARGLDSSSNRSFYLAPGAAHTFRVYLTDSYYDIIKIDSDNRASADGTYPSNLYVDVRISVRREGSSTWLLNKVDARNYTHSSFGQTFRVTGITTAGWYEIIIEGYSSTSNGIYEIRYY